MARKYTRHFNTRVTPQSERIPGTSQVPNSAGGFSWAVDDWERMRRFLILGSEGGTYYIGEKQLTKENAESVLRCIGVDGARAVDLIVEISDQGRAPKNDPAIFALALAAAFGDAQTRARALSSLPKVCRTGTHLFHFAEAHQAFRGWSRSLRTAVAGWYQQDAGKVAYQAVKYRERDGWSHRDLLRLAHPKAPTAAHRAVYGWIVGGADEVFTHSLLPAIPDRDLGALKPIMGLEILREAKSADRVVSIISDYGLPREAVESANTEWLKDPDVWGVLLEDMPLEATVRNLGVMTNRGLLKPMAPAVGEVVSRLSNEELIRKARLHPLKVLLALKTYQSGQSRGSLTWTPVQQVADALDGAFYKGFKAMEPTGKRIMLALDVSGSMRSGQVAGTSLTPREAAAAMALVVANVEPNHVIVSFQAKGGRQQTWSSHHRDDGIVPLNISPRQRLDDVVRATSALPFGGTDCALPMLYALERGLEIDSFIVLTDSETWAGDIHPTQALRQYRERTGIPAKMVVVGMTSNGFSIADPNDRGMLDVCGFDSAVPELINDFVRGNS